MPNTNSPVAYLCLEYALEQDLPIYAGGLGVLAADLVFQAGSDGKNFHAFGLYYSHGFHAHNEDSKLDPTPCGFSLLKNNLGQVAYFSLRVDGQESWFCVWTKSYGSAKVFLLDMDIDQNSEPVKKITRHLYDSNHEIMLRQQFVLAFGTQKVLKLLAITPEVFHLNEGHTAFSILARALELIKDNQTLSQSIETTRNQTVASKHTILTGGGMYLTKQQLQSVVGEVLEEKHTSFDDFFALGTDPSHPDQFSTTSFLMRNSRLANAVSVAHAQAEKKVHPNSTLIPITNGINSARWRASNLSSLSLLSDLSLWKIHQENKQKLLDYLKTFSPNKLDPSVLTVSWARRFASYKRPDLLFKNVEELSKATKLLPAVQFIVAGQTNPDDDTAIEIAADIEKMINTSELKNRVIFLQQYDLHLAQILVAGSDVWLNTPTPGVEASGTSGMKSGINGTLQFSTLDGWVPEVNWDAVGWTIPEENISQKLYSILETEIIPCYYHAGQNNLPTQWIKQMRKTIEVIDEKYTTQRVLDDYYSKLYFPS